VPAYSDERAEAVAESALRPQECGRGSLKGYATKQPDLLVWAVKKPRDILTVLVLGGR
jgi:hypothetical protein